MRQQDALKVQKQIENILEQNGIYYKSEKVITTELKFININISIKVTKE